MLSSACGHAYGAELGSLICGWELLCKAHSPRRSVPIPQVGVDVPWWDQTEPNWMGRPSRDDALWCWGASPAHSKTRTRNKYTENNFYSSSSTFDLFIQPQTMRPNREAGPNPSPTAGRLPFPGRSPQRGGDPRDKTLDP